MYHQCHSAHLPQGSVSRADFFSPYSRDPAQLFSSPRHIALASRPAGAGEEWEEEQQRASSAR